MKKETRTNSMYAMIIILMFILAIIGDMLALTIFLNDTYNFMFSALLGNSITFFVMLAFFTHPKKSRHRR